MKSKFITLFISVALSTQSQNIITNATTIDSLGVIYTAFESSSINNKHVSVKKIKDTAWTYVGQPAVASGKLGPYSLTINAKNLPVLAYQDEENNNKCSVISYNGSTWNSIGKKGFSKGAIKFPAIAIDKTTDNIYVSFVDSLNNNNITVMNYNGKEWQILGQNIFLKTNVNQTSIYYNQAEKCVYTAFLSSTCKNKISVFKFNGLDWIGVDNESLTEENIASVFINSSSNGAPLLFYTQKNKTKILEYKNGKWVKANLKGNKNLHHPSIMRTQRLMRH
ncbi:MAG: hypothetical protein JSU07_06575 [Bacteroidetes bacterium]|nr:hypothetical protein [Bacteroidota bacterium]